MMGRPDSRKWSAHLMRVWFSHDVNRSESAQLAPIVAILSSLLKCPFPLEEAFRLKRRRWFSLRRQRGANANISGHSTMAQLSRRPPRKPLA